MKGIDFKPAYLNLSESKFVEKIEKLYQILESCSLCPRKCGANRLKGEKGSCNSGARLKVSSIGPHFGEESPLVGRRGSGTVFLTNCNLHCVFCQNYDISQLGRGDFITPQKLASRILNLQRRGCHNINFVTPTHFASQLVKTIMLAVQGGLKVPIVWNCGGYESPEVIKLLEGIVDIYMPDFKYGRNQNSSRYSEAPEYFTKAKEVIKEMHKQVGDLKVRDGIAKRGLLIRHLVLPNNIAGSEKVLQFIAQQISTDSYVNIMDQYRPSYRADEYQELARHPTREEFIQIIETAKNLGLYRGFNPSIKLF